MKIYISHSTNFNYREKLYDPLKKSQLVKVHEFIFPHEANNSTRKTKEQISLCDLFVAEVSRPSIGVGIELGWADIFEKRIICIHKTGMHITKSLSFISSEIIQYNSHEDLISRLESTV